MVESSENPRAVNPADPSYGLMQILCPADSMDSRCRNRLPAIPDFASATPRRLLDDVDFNLSIAAQLLAWNISRYGREGGIAVYNCWDSRLDLSAGREPRNQDYVDKVLAAYQRAAI